VRQGGNVPHPKKRRVTTDRKILRAIKQQRMSWAKTESVWGFVGR